MFSYILSFFRKPPAELSAEDAAAILTQDTDCLVKNSTETSNLHEKLFKDEYNFSTVTGRITGKQENCYIIDQLYEFLPDGEEFEIGTPVSYQKLVSEGNIVIYNVNPISNDWDTVTEKTSILTTRVMICKVEKRDRRVLILSPGDINVDLDKASIEFIPLVGDWLEIDVKYEVDDHSLDLSGKVVEVNRISPVRPHIVNGKISFWDALDQSGCINNKVFFDKDSLSCGYVPIVGDQVVAQIIESDQNKCSWRALKILPEFLSKKFQTQEDPNQDSIKESHPGLKISCCPLSFDKLGETRPFNISVTNESTETFTLLNVELLETNCQVAFLNGPPESDDILPDRCLNLSLSCTAKTMGTSNELLVFHFRGFTIGKYVNIAVNTNRSGSYYQKNRFVNHTNSYRGDKQVIRGQRASVTRFQHVRLPDYRMPKKLLDLVIKYEGQKERVNFIEELKVVKRSLFADLNAMNYEEKFHTLLHMDEIASLLSIRQYDLERTCFIRNGEFLMLEIENLAERRPSIVLGDRIMASDPLKMSEQEYEGNVFRVGAKHVYLKFSSMFHDSYKGEDYSIRVIPGRSAYKRQHHSIYLVARNLGRDWLFPTKIIERPPQVDFIYDQYSPKAIDMNNKTSDEGYQVKPKKIFKLEWYNQTLNCKQKDAVINILKGVSRPLPYIIFGPPGTGKTVTVIESILQVLRMIPECRILVTAPSNSAADLIALRLIDFGVLKPGDLVRLVSVNYAVGEHIPAKLVPYCVTGSFAKEGTAEENILSQNGMTFDCSRAVLGRHKITVSTCSSAASLHMMGFLCGHFSHIFVDEAGQAAEPEVMIPVSFLDKSVGQVVLAGDPMQLGPAIISDISRECGLNESYLERLINRFPYARDIQGFPDSEGFDPRLVTKLLHNYRSLGVILKLFSTLFYHGDLIPTISDTDSAESRLLQSLASILPKTKEGAVPSMVFHGVEGENYQTTDSPSWFNPHEAAQVFYYINEFLRLGLESENIGVITPYIKQVREIRQLLKEAEFSVPKIGTVEDFQGQEFGVILLSTVRSSRNYVARDITYSLGFVSSPRRLNVAISRPKSLLVIIGNPALLSGDTYWRTVISYCVQNGAYTGCSFAS